jgi:DNA-directed RNA polymerase specialized sigma24 family protein
LSAIVSTGSHDLKERQRAYESLILAYWKPVYKTVRLKWNKSNEDAKDLTQAFFTRAMEKGFLIVMTRRKRDSEHFCEPASRDLFRTRRRQPGG